MSQKDILLVEDNPDDVELTRIAFAEANVANRLEVVGDGAQALDYLVARGEYAHRDPGDLPSSVDRKQGGEGKRVSVRVDRGGRRIMKEKNTKVSRRHHGKQ